MNNYCPLDDLDQVITNSFPAVFWVLVLAADREDKAPWNAKLLGSAFEGFPQQVTALLIFLVAFQQEGMSNGFPRRRRKQRGLVRVICRWGCELEADVG